jgi:serine protease
VRGSNANALVDRLRGVPGLQTAWAITQGSAAPVVAVLDTGITAHPDLDAHVLPGYDFVSTLEYAGDGDGRDADPSDPGDFVSNADKAANPALFSGCAVENSSWHGTDIAGIVAAVTDNATGVAGVSWRARVLPVRVAGKCGADVRDIVDGMYWAAGVQLFDSAGLPLPLNPNPAKVVNISFGGSDACSAAYQDAIDDLSARGVIVVAAAGNQHGAVSRPASCNGVVGVAAVNRDGFKTHYSNFGSRIVLATVGGDPSADGRWGALLGDDGLLTLDNAGLQGPDTRSVVYSRVSGTSFATPIVSGVISLMLSVNPGLTVPQLMAGLRASARPHVVSAKIGVCSAQNPGRCLCTAATCGAGLLDADQALRYALAPAAYVVPARQAQNIDSADVDAAVALGADLDAAPAPASGSGGGGALNGAWLLALTAAVVLLGSCRR